MLQARNVFHDERREAATKNIHSPPGQKGSSPSAGDCQQDAFDEQLSDKLPSAGPEADANGHLFLAAGNASQLQIGDVDAGKQQDKNCSTHHYHNKLASSESQV